MAELTGRELDAEVAEVVMGWRWLRSPDGLNRTLTTVREETALRRSGWVDALGDEIQLFAEPPFSTDPTAVRQVEDEIERHGLQTDYLLHLCAELRTPPPACLEVPGVWMLLRATPEERCRAAVRAVRGKTCDNADQV